MIAILSICSRKNERAYSVPINTPDGCFRKLFINFSPSIGFFMCSLSIMNMGAVHISWQAYSTVSVPIPSGTKSQPPHF